MRVWPAVLVAALAASGCAHKGETSDAPAGGSGGTSVSVASGGSTGGTSNGSGGGSANTGGTTTGGNSGGSVSSGGSPGSGGDTPGGGGGTNASGGETGKDATGTTESGPPPVAGGKAMLIVGTIPLVGTDTVFESTLKAHGLEVEIVQEKTATPAMAEGKRLLFFSYSMSSTAFNAEPFTNTPVPIIVTEHNLLSRIKMAAQHGFTPSNLTKITIISDHELAGGFPKGDVEVYMKQQEMFWGVPSPMAISIAHITGSPTKITYFAYEKGAMMDGVAAPAKGVQFFHATHSPDPIDKNLYLNENGIKLLGTTIDWCLK